MIIYYNSIWISFDQFVFAVQKSRSVTSHVQHGNMCYSETLSLMSYQDVYILYIIPSVYKW